MNQPALEEYLTPASWWHRLQPLTRHTQLPGAGHYPEWESPDALTADLLDFAAHLKPASRERRLNPSANDRSRRS